MRKIFFILVCLIFISDFADAQVRRRRRPGQTYMARTQRIGEFSYLGSAGISSYFGDLKQSVNLWAKPTLGGGVQYRATPNLSVRGELLWYRISGADTLNEKKYSIYDRNLSFRADNVEFNISALYYFFNKYSKTRVPIINPYAFAGLGFTTNTPKAYYQGEWHKLRPLQTEGVDYSGVLVTVPFGLGITYHDLIPQFDFAIETGYRYTFNDYMDDASTVYREESTFGGNELAYALSDRRGELEARTGEEARYKGMNYRGNPGNNDWYMLTSLKVTYTPGRPRNATYYRKNAKRFRRAKY